MRVLILGSGVVGVATAYYLSREGHEVVVADRRDGPGMETSFANAGQVSPGYSSPWAAPGIPLKVLRWMTQPRSPFVLRPKLDWAQWRWMTQMLGNCTANAYARNKARMVRLAEYSRDQLRDLRDETGIAYDNRERGTLQLFRTQKQMDHTADDIAVLKSYGVAYEVLDRAGCIAAEPGLQWAQVPLVGGLRLPGDETGDAHLFTRELARICMERGVSFLFGTQIHGFSTQGDKITAIRSSRGDLMADAYVCALGSYSPLLLKQIGIAAPIYPVKGYSMTIPITDETHAPVSTVMDETYKIAITRLGNRIRVGGTAELAGYDTRLRQERRMTLEGSVKELFPDSGDLPAATFWSGLRPMTPDGTPIIGPTRYRNLHLNTGHGTLGWTMSCGSGRLLADMISGKRPNIDHADLAIARYAG
ncbi:D-amino acid dehydrogenase [Granulibacter bethesdensis]|uniref:D-amino acid dehydrogenase n=1 Tax=Granulibacter bethesdensis (strain ATCC BAA-1260 / CGDNIH1) TaxID=391165 RepID=DADA_GRABC|nr:D-amino acid dehydrogenase [Granulibacter bethesdensis]Q0BUV2.1 RecName: Full=D-amino acid dehydrogenase [Granulibacter bethesdensis CGDNIH1]ABI61400.1 D-amino acid dehydrogenase small subunit [Granulibacter bethesdensis CGDNIH1]APH51192.1 D-amino acid dehydrogenase small subunit [Granulibacter bethesdensis]APH63886.1 D-amino acid dehydrogenase small subunit [Granulibacter bethesdensis]